MKPIKALFVIIAIITTISWNAESVAADALPIPTVIGPIPVNVEPGDPSCDYTIFTPIEDLSF